MRRLALPPISWFPPLDKGGLRGGHSGEISDEAILAAGLQARKSPFSILFQRGRGPGTFSHQDWQVVRFLLPRMSFGSIRATGSRAWAFESGFPFSNREQYLFQ